LLELRVKDREEEASRGEPLRRFERGIACSHQALNVEYTLCERGGDDPRLLTEERKDQDSAMNEGRSLPPNPFLQY
jgi:hypothetical protein